MKEMVLKRHLHFDKNKGLFMEERLYNDLKSGELDSVLESFSNEDIIQLILRIYHYDVLHDDNYIARQLLSYGREEYIKCFKAFIIYNCNDFMNILKGYPSSIDPQLLFDLYEYLYPLMRTIGVKTYKQRYLNYVFQTKGSDPNPDTTLKTFYHRFGESRGFRKWD